MTHDMKSRSIIYQSLAKVVAILCNGKDNIGINELDEMTKKLVAKHDQFVQGYGVNYDTPIKDDTARFTHDNSQRPGQRPNVFGRS